MTTSRHSDMEAILDEKLDKHKELEDTESALNSSLRSLKKKLKNAKTTEDKQKIEVELEKMKMVKNEMSCM